MELILTKTKKKANEVLASSNGGKDLKMYKEYLYTDTGEINSFYLALKVSYDYDDIPDKDIKIKLEFNKYENRGRLI